MSATSSLALLRQRKAEKESDQKLTASRLSTAVAPSTDLAATTRAKAKAKDMMRTDAPGASLKAPAQATANSVPAQIPARPSQQTKTRVESTLPPPTGKLQSRKNGMLTNTPIPNQMKAVQSRHKRKDGPEDIDDDGDVEAAHDTRKRTKLGQRRSPANEKRVSKSGPLKRPSRASEAAATTVGRTTNDYDVPESSPKVKATTKTRPGGQRAKASVTEPAIPIHSRPPETVSRNTRSKTKQQPNAKQASKSQQPEGKDASQKLKTMKKEAANQTEKGVSDEGIDKGALAGIPAASGTNITTLERHPPERQTSAAVAEDKASVEETIEDFEEAVLQYDEHGSQIAPRAPANLSTVASGLRATLTKSDTQADADHDEYQDGAQLLSQDRDAETDLNSTHRKQRGKAGDSEENAIMIAEPPNAATSSPQLRSPPPAPVKRIVVHSRKTAAKVPVTPAIFRSSPPAAAEDKSATRHGLVDDSLALKSRIIAFDKSGPRNQGSGSARKVMGSANTVRTSYTGRDAPTGIRPSISVENLATLHNIGSSAAHSMKSMRTNREVQPSNVAEDVDDALGSFFAKSIVPTDAVRALLTQPTTGRRATTHVGRPTEGTECDDDDFQAIDELEGQTQADPDSRVQGPPSALLDHGKSLNAMSYSASHIKKPTMSQQAMPPPRVAAVPRVVLAQQRDIHKAPTAPTILPREDGHSLAVVTIPDQTMTEPTEPAADMSTARKRPPEQTAQQEPMPKRARSLSDSGGIVISHRHSQRVFSSQQPPLDSIPSDTEITLVQRAPALSPPVGGLNREPVKRGSRKLSRNISQGSQTVDLQGSPIPPDMVVPERSTVLETFSQQAELSSDISQLACVAGLNRKVAGSKMRHPMTVRERFNPPDQQAELLSSNTKLLPASPEAPARQAVAGRVIKERLMVSDAAAGPSTDPFTRSDEGHSAQAPLQSSSGFLDNLRKKVGVNLERGAGQSKDIPRYEKQNTDEDDADRTLVNQEEYEKSLVRDEDSSDSSSQSSLLESDASDTTQLDLMTWRSALKPHQVVLFDELINISHRLVRHLVSVETAKNDIVAEYHRRGLALVEQMEQAHVREYNQYVESLKRRKQRMRKELDRCDQELQTCMATVRDARRTTAQSSVKFLELKQNLSDIMAEYC